MHCESRLEHNRESQREQKYNLTDFLPCLELFCSGKASHILGVRMAIIARDDRINYASYLHRITVLVLVLVLVLE